MYGGEILKKFIKSTAVFISVITVMIFSLIVYGDISLPDEISSDKSNALYSVLFSTEINYDHAYQAVNTDVPGNIVNSGKIKLLGAIPVKEISVNESKRKYLIPGGELVGIRLKTDGVLIVGTESFDSTSGEVSPANEAGIQIGDTLISIDGIRVTTNEQISDIIQLSDGENLDVEISRNGKHLDLTITPEISTVTGHYKCGLWIRDSTGGIGTLTYCDIETGSFASLGHGIYDVDTGSLLPTQQGALSNAALSGVRKGTSGNAGELKGSITGEVYGNIISNNENGIYGTLSYYTLDTNPLPVAYMSEIETGPAQIISTVSDNKKEYYDIEIEKLNKSSDNKNMIIRITDDRLLDITGGIVQGMSGSPIIQNGKIIGAVTHVFVNDPPRGYGIFIGNMLETAENL